MNKIYIFDNTTTLRQALDIIKKDLGNRLAGIEPIVNKDNTIKAIVR